MRKYCQLFTHESSTFLGEQYTIRHSAHAWSHCKSATDLTCWQFGVVVASFVAWTKLLYVEPDDYWDG